MARKNKRQQLLEVPPVGKILTEPLEHPELDLPVDGEEEEEASQPRLEKLVVTKRRRKLEE